HSNIDQVPESPTTATYESTIRGASTTSRSIQGSVNSNPTIFEQSNGCVELSEDDLPLIQVTCHLVCQFIGLRFISRRDQTPLARMSRPQQTDEGSGESEKRTGIKKDKVERAGEFWYVHVDVLDLYFLPRPYSSARDASRAAGCPLRNARTALGPCCPATGRIPNIRDFNIFTTEDPWHSQCGNVKASVETINKRCQVNLSSFGQDANKQGSTSRHVVMNGQSLVRVLEYLRNSRVSPANHDLRSPANQLASGCHRLGIPAHYFSPPTAQLPVRNSASLI
ncbi:unnamed protein product, partial [Nesidiocoris tenuis]